ncbi:hypothetical protein HMI54_004349 [Coelomomyces lativittatus]|nr:hypothetical protein HMI54_004349 [Coelomomyces lativittatus]
MESIYRSLWRHYYEGQNALIFVIDAVNSERIDEAINELHMTLLHPSMQNVPLLILANTAGSKNAMSLDSIHEKLNLVLVSKSKWSIFHIDAFTGEGVKKSIKWLSRCIEKDAL